MAVFLGCLFENDMNDFTKEELNILYKCIRLAEIDHGECSDLDNIKFKIHSMIDNYCEHEWENIYSGSTIRGIYCQRKGCGIRLKGS